MTEDVELIKRSELATLKADNKALMLTLLEMRGYIDTSIRNAGVSDELAWKGLSEILTNGLAKHTEKGGG